MTSNRDPSATINRFADLLAEGLSTDQAATRVGKSGAYGRAMLVRIRRRLGPQAT